MKHLLTFTKTCWAVILVAAIGLATYGCSDSVSISEQTVEVPLSSLTVTPGTIQPAFSSNITTYTVDAPTGAATVTVVATPKSSTTLVTIDGTISTQRSIPLGPPGSIKIIPIVLESQNGLTSTYTVTVTRLLSGDNNLSALSVKVNNATQPLIPGFDANTLGYTVDVQTSVASVTIAATKSDPNAAMLIGSTTIPAGTNPGQASITLGSPGTTTPVTIEVTAPNSSKKTYTLSIKRLAGDTNLSALSIAPHSLNPGFTANTVSYVVDVAHDIASVTVSATKSDPNAVMQVHSVTVPAGTALGQDTITLNGAGLDTTVSVVVTAQNGVDSKPYTITVHRAAPSSNNNLDTLTVTPGSMNPIFAPSITDYTADVATNDNSVTVTATLQDANATMLINGQGTSSGQPREITPLQPQGENTLITIVVRAQNETERAYTVTVRRPLPSSDDKLRALSAVLGTLDPPFDANLSAYTVINIPPGEPTVMVTATKSDVNAVMSIGSEIVPAGTETGQVPVPVGINATVTIVVTAQNGVDSETYTVTVP